MESCINNHAPEHIDIRSDGSRVCLACKHEIMNRKNCARRRNQSMRTSATLRRTENEPHARR